MKSNLDGGILEEFLSIILIDWLWQGMMSAEYEVLYHVHSCIGLIKPCWVQCFINSSRTLLTSSQTLRYIYIVNLFIACAPESKQ